MRFLIDECLTIDLVATANQAGHEAWHVARLGKAGWKDWNVTRHAVDQGLALVTNNAGDFRRLYAAEPIHAGLIIIVPNVNRAMQRQLFRGALEELVPHHRGFDGLSEARLQPGQMIFMHQYDDAPWRSWLS